MALVELARSGLKANGKTKRDIEDPLKKQEVLSHGRSPLEQSVLNWYIQRHEGWDRVFATIINFGQMHGVPMDEVHGTVDTILLVLIADQIIDTPGEFKQKRDPSAFRSKLVAKNIGDTDVTVGQLLHETRERLASTPKKQQLLDTYLNEVILLHTSMKAQIPGSYSYGDAVAYREATNSRGLEVAFALLDIHSPKLLDLAKQRLRIAQFKDEIKDVGIDFREESTNLFLGIASQYSTEFSKLKTYLDADRECNPSVVWLQNNMPSTWASYIRKVNAAKWKFRLLEGALFVPSLPLRRGRER